MKRKIRRIAGLLLAAAVMISPLGELPVQAADASAAAQAESAGDAAGAGGQEQQADQSQPEQPGASAGQSGSEQPGSGTAGNQNETTNGEQTGTTGGGNETQPGAAAGNQSGTGGSEGAGGTNGSQSGTNGSAGGNQSGTNGSAGGNQSGTNGSAGGNQSGTNGSSGGTNGGQSGTNGSSGGTNGGQSGTNDTGGTGSTGGTNGSGGTSGSGNADGTAGGANQTQSSKTVEGEVIIDKNNDDIEIGKNDRPYLALGADLSEQQRSVVLGIMGIDPASLGNYDVVYVTNQEEHQYLDSYISSSQIGSRSLSSVLIIERKKGSGLNISTNNITYCTVGMYKNALVTAGITDADIIVAGPTGISGTAALVGVFKAYQEMTGKVIDAEVIDVALNELVVTGELEAAIDELTDEEVEEFIAYIKSVIAENDLSDEASINRVIDEACEKYGVELSDSERQQIVDLLLKLTSLGIDLNGLVDYAQSLYKDYKNGGGSGILASIGNFFSNIFTAIGDFFKGLFSW